MAREFVKNPHFLAIKLGSRWRRSNPSRLRVSSPICAPSIAFPLFPLQQLPTVGSLRRHCPLLLQEAHPTGSPSAHQHVLNYLRMRLFVGMPLAPAVVSELKVTVVRLRSNGDGLRWTEPASWHITLQFLGNTDEEQYRCVVARLAEVHSRSVPVHLADLGFFERAGVFFADVSPTPELVSLAGRIMAATSQCGFVPKTRPYHPHITLARAKGHDRNQPLRTLQQRINRPPNFARFVASEFVLYESHLSPAGSTYENRHRFPLSAT